MSNPESDLRDALRARAGAVPLGRADEAGLGRRLAAAQRRRRAKVGGAALALLVAVSAVSVVARADGPGPNVVAGPDPSSTTTPSGPTSTAPAPTTTVAPAPTSTAAGGPPTAPARSGTSSSLPRTTSTTSPLAPLPDDAIWPPPASATSFPTAERAAGDFARRFLGMATPQVIPGRVSVRGDEATVELRARPEGGPVTMVLLRRTDLRGWVVVGCSAERIQVEQPAAGARVGSPLTVRGRAQAFEGTVDVEVRRDGATAPIGRAFGTGGGTEVLPFEATVSFARPPVPRGTLVVSEARADDDSQGPAAATVLRISF